MAYYKASLGYVGAIILPAEQVATKQSPELVEYKFTNQSNISGELL